MAGTFSQIYIQMVFAVRGRRSLIHNSWEEELYKYISGIIRNKEQKLLAINGMPDHIHILIGLRPACCISDLVREIKKSSNDFINKKRFLPYNFQWQDGYGAFSYSHSEFGNIIKYIENQKIHHKTKSFKEEYKALLDEFEISHKDEHLFEWIEID